MRWLDLLLNILTFGVYGFLRLAAKIRRDELAMSGRNPRDWSESIAPPPWKEPRHD